MLNALFGRTTEQPPSPAFSNLSSIVDSLPAASAASREEDIPLPISSSKAAIISAGMTREEDIPLPIFILESGHDLGGDDSCFFAPTSFNIMDDSMKGSPGYRREAR
jgi:hypothetical protein